MGMHRMYHTFTIQLHRHITKVFGHRRNFTIEAYEK